MRNHLEVDIKTLKRYDKPGPRYTSYPTAVEFHSGVGESAYRKRLEELEKEAPEAPLSLYFHLPFCESRCLFCACNVVISRQTATRRRYLDAIKKEIELVAAAFSTRRRVLQLHWGGGTPTSYPPEDLEELYRCIEAHFDLDTKAEIAVEIDPCVTSVAHLETLHRLGFNRLSLGVQDFSPEVQRAIERNQSYEETRDLVAEIRKTGFPGGINLDLIYGLPLQEARNFQNSLNRILELRPERLALYSFAFVPWLKAHQRRIDTHSLPNPDQKLQIYLKGYDCLLDAGYQAIGMDHFALPSDELSIASDEGRLFRNFMGYTVHPAQHSLAFGMTGIGDLESGYFQNHKRLSTYLDLVEGGHLPIQRGVLLTREDRIRRWAITRLMCNFKLNKEDFSSEFELDFDHHFHDEKQKMTEFLREGFLQDSAKSLQVLGAGRLFVRNIAMIFDQYRKTGPSSGPVFSRTV